MHFKKYLAIFALLAIKITLQKNSASSLKVVSQNIPIEYPIFFQEESDVRTQDYDIDSAEDALKTIEEAIPGEKAEQQETTEQPQPIEKELSQESSSSPNNDSDNVETDKKLETSPKPLPEEPKEESVEKPAEETQSS
uniref:Secreted protein n=1 Tax=Strongyloides stercoralis TaxID=6248 RepID=A0A0K0E6A1_STRER